MKAAILGNDGRSNAIADSLRRGHHPWEIISLPAWDSSRAPAELLSEAVAAVRTARPTFVIIGPERPLAAGVVDAIENETGVPCIGPRQVLAQLETSKAFTRELLREHNIPGNPRYRVFRSMNGIEEYLRAEADYVIKPDGLTDGKGVKLSGAHLANVEAAVEYCRGIFADGHAAIVIEEKLEGEEFSLMSFCDGKSALHMVAVQDHKRAYENDEGPNTGGMGSYSCPDGSMPFITEVHLIEAEHINRAVMEAVQEQIGTDYRGILFGGFMVTRNGLRLIEYNVRFGDPEAMNALSVLNSDFGDVCQSMLNATLHRQGVNFREEASVCKYVVPRGYPDAPVRGEIIDLSGVRLSPNLRMHLGSVESTDSPHQFRLRGSRAVAFVGTGQTLAEAEQIAEAAATAVSGPVFHRQDIGKPELVAKRVEHMRRILK